MMVFHDSPQLVLAGTEASDRWPETAVAIAGIAMIVAIAVAVIVQIFATARTRMSIRRDAEYQRLAEELAGSQRRTAEQLELATTELAQLRARTGEVERVIKEIE